MPSTSIRNSRYDPESRTLSVWFVASGKRYDYFDVPPETYAAMRSAYSKGRFFNVHIRDRFAFRHVEESDGPSPRGGMSNRPAKSARPREPFG